MSVVTSEESPNKEEVMKDLENFGKKIPEEVKQRLLKVLDKIKADAFDYCPKDTWTLARTIRWMSIPTLASLKQSGEKALIILDKALVAGDPTKINPKTGRPCIYARWVHDGHRLRNGMFWVGRPFLTWAWSANEVELNKAIEGALKKLGKDFSSKDVKVV